MCKINVRSCWHGIIMLFLLHEVAAAQPLSLSQLRDQIFSKGTTSGQFLQCTNQGSASIVGSGHFIFEPGKRIELNFEHPNRYTVVFFSNGTQSRTVGGIEQKSPRHSSVGILMFSLMNMRQPFVDSRFETTLNGTLDQFHIGLKPKKRMAKIVQSVEMSGASGSLHKIQIKTGDNRAIAVHLFPTGTPEDATCE